MQPAPQPVALTNPAIPPAAALATAPKPQPGAMNFGGQLAKALAVNVEQLSTGTVLATGLPQQPAAPTKLPVGAPGQSTATTAQSVTRAMPPGGAPVQSVAAAEQLPPDASAQSSAPEQAAPEPSPSTPVPTALVLPPPAETQAPTAQQPAPKSGTSTERPRMAQGTRRDLTNIVDTDVMTPTAAVLPATPADQPVQQLPPAHSALPSAQQPTQPQHAPIIVAIEANVGPAQPVAHSPVAQQSVADTPATAAVASIAPQADAQKSATVQSAAPSIVEPALAAQPTAAPAPPPPSSAPPAVTHSAQAVTPAAQLAPALVALGRAPDGAQRITMRLEPPELGQVQVRIDRPTDAPARVDITVERNETLTLLLRDQPQLQRALDLAGVPADGRTLTFHVATPEPAQRADSSPISTSSGAASTGSAGEFSHGAARQGDSGGGNATQQAISNDDGGETDSAPIAMMSWLRAGLDITA